MNRKSIVDLPANFDEYQLKHLLLQSIALHFTGTSSESPDLSLFVYQESQGHASCFRVYITLLKRAISLENMAKKPFFSGTAL